MDITFQMKMHAAHVRQAASAAQMNAMQSHFHGIK